MSRDSIRVSRDTFGERRHEFRQASGRWQRCLGPGYCRECIREADARKAKRDG